MVQSANMQKSPFHLSHLVPFLPYLYFSLLPVSSFLSGLGDQATFSTLLLLIPALPFIMQLCFSFKHVDLILGVLTFAISLYFTLAWLSDLVKITSYTTRAINFIWVGGCVVILNYVMSVRLFRNEFMRTERAKEMQQAY
jgi:hypothetical protein